MAQEIAEADEQDGAKDESQVSRKGEKELFATGGRRRYCRSGWQGQLQQFTGRVKKSTREGVTH